MINKDFLKKTFFGIFSFVLLASLIPLFFLLPLHLDPRMAIAIPFLSPLQMLSVIVVMKALIRMEEKLGI